MIVQSDQANAWTDDLAKSGVIIPRPRRPHRRRPHRLSRPHRRRPYSACGPPGAPHTAQGLGAALTPQITRHFGAALFCVFRGRGGNTRHRAPAPCAEPPAGGVGGMHDRRRPHRRRPPRRSPHRRRPHRLSRRPHRRHPHRLSRRPHHHRPHRRCLTAAALIAAALTAAAAALTAAALTASAAALTYMADD